MVKLTVNAFREQDRSLPNNEFFDLRSARRQRIGGDGSRVNVLGRTPALAPASRLVYGLLSI